MAIDPIVPGETSFADAAAALNIVLQFADVCGIDINDDTDEEIKDKLLAVLTPAISDISGLQTALDAKADTADLPAELTGADIRTLITDGADAADLRAFIVACYGLAQATSYSHSAGAVVVAATMAGETELESASPAAEATLAEYLTGTADDRTLTVDVARFMALPQTKTYAASVTITLSGDRTDDGDASDSDTLETSIACTNDCDVDFDDIDAGLVGEEGVVTFLNSGGGTFDCDVVTGNGITVEYATGVTNPGLGTSDGDRLDAVFRIISTTLVRIERFISDPA